MGPVNIHEINRYFSMGVEIQCGPVHIHEINRYFSVGVEIQCTAL